MILVASYQVELQSIQIVSRMCCISYIFAHCNLKCCAGYNICYRSFSQTRCEGAPVQCFYQVMCVDEHPSIRMGPAWWAFAHQSKSKSIVFSLPNTSYKGGTETVLIFFLSNGAPLFWLPRMCILTLSGFQVFYSGEYKFFGIFITKRSQHVQSV